VRRSETPGKHRRENSEPANAGGQHSDSSVKQSLENITDDRPLKRAVLCVAFVTWGAAALHPRL
jgi:hypothetical protein